MKSQVLPRVVGKAAGKASPLKVVEGVKAMAEAYTEWQRISAQETVKRHEIDAWRTCQLQRLTDQRELMESYFQRTFSERAGNFGELFARLDAGIAAGNSELISGCLSAIVDIAKTSPLEGVKAIFDALEDPNVDEIVI
ncbi:MAG: hypothetical protein RBS05_15465 [Zoogloea oleivorans]|jgi:hypothetical protein|uniref:hypothetical protein n=1 Tax=Zoogloea oleivorans TaxID=1552750 RepID=UPI002A36EE67|nr:hypothetical protein [Zoogloea oleivorans]MDY0037307.1 hypothetical protein [Zoogloea oleivorans]